MGEHPAPHDDEDNIADYNEPKCFICLNDNGTWLVHLMAMQRTCAFCGGNFIVGPHKVFGGGDGFDRHIKIDLPGIRTATLESFTCAHCGHVEFFVDVGGLANIRNMINYVPSTSPTTARYQECPSCSAVIKSGSRFCSNCGTPL